MRHPLYSKVLFPLALSLCVMLVQGFGSQAIAQPDTTGVRIWGSITLDLSPSLPDTIHTVFDGVARLIWNESAPFQITAEMDTCRLQDWLGFWMNEDQLFPSFGEFVLPDEYWGWGESFFDIYMEIHVSELPGETLKMLSPLHLVGMANAWPPYFDSLRTPEEMPPVPLYIEGIESGRILSCELEMAPYYDPEAHVSVPTAYGSEVALLDDEGLIAVNVALTGDYEPTEATFGYRLFGDPGPFTVFDVDMDGSARHYPPGEPAIYGGDGWTGHFDPGSDPFNEGQVVEFEASLFVPSLGTFKDTVHVWVEETPPLPEIVSIGLDSIASFDIDSFFDVTFKVDDEWLTPGLSQLLLFPLEPSCERELIGLSQYDLGTPLDSVSCVPVTSAMIIKYFAMNGYPGLDCPWGDTTRTLESIADIAKELQKLMRLARKKGADEKLFPVATGGFLRGRGRWEWRITFEEVLSVRNIAHMYREFASDSEGVLLCISDTDSTGKQVTVTASLDGVYASPGGPIVIGFTDPIGQHHTHPLDFSGGPPPTIVGYDAPGCTGGDAKLLAWASFSPVWVPTPGAELSGEPAKAPLRAPWIPVDSGIARGNGLVDTLRFDTSPFPPGWYLMEVVTLDDQGFECRDIRLVEIGSTTGADDPRAPGVKTGLRGSYPNPFNPSTTIEYSLARKATVGLVIYDAAGRRVKTLISSTMTEAGVHKVNWDGTNDNGTRLASGVYFASLVVEGRLSAKKLILLR